MQTIHKLAEPYAYKCISVIASEPAPQSRRSGLWKPFVLKLPPACCKFRGLITVDMFNDPESCQIAVGIRIQAEVGLRLARLQVPARLTQSTVVLGLRPMCSLTPGSPQTAGPTMFIAS